MLDYLFETVAIDKLTGQKIPRIAMWTLNLAMFAVALLVLIALPFIIADLPFIIEVVTEWVSNLV
jgi:hypothetical protein